MSRKRAVSKRPRTKVARTPGTRLDASKLPRLKASTAFAKEMNVLAAEQFGGIENVSPLERVLWEKFSHLQATSRFLELEIRSGNLRNVATYTSVVDRIHSIAKSLGLARRAKPVRRLADELAQHDQSPPPGSPSTDAGRSCPIGSPESPAAGGQDR